MLIFSFLSGQATGSLCENLTASLVFDVLSVGGKHNKRLLQTFFSLFFSDFNGSWHPKCRTAATFSLHLKHHPAQNSYSSSFSLYFACKICPPIDIIIVHPLCSSPFSFPFLSSLFSSPSFLFFLSFPFPHVKHCLHASISKHCSCFLSLYYSSQNLLILLPAGF